MKSHVELLDMLVKASGDAGKLERAMKVIKDHAIEEYKNRLSDSSLFVDVNSLDLEDKRDAEGRRRFNVRNSAEGFVMVPDKDGFWTPALD